MSKILLDGRMGRSILGTRHAPLHPCVLSPYPLDYPLTVRTLQGYGSVLYKVRRFAVLDALLHGYLAARLAHQDQAAPHLETVFVEHVAHCH